MRGTADAAPSAAPGRRGVALLVMAASGFAGLGYEIVWTRQSALWLGHEAASVLAVVAAFFGGLGLGALLFGGRIERSRSPLRWYVLCELLIAGWALLLTVALAPLGDLLMNLTGVSASPLHQWSITFAGVFLCLLPATAAMGATLPAMECLLPALGTDRRQLAALYASNTFGGVIGVLAIAFWLAPALGYLRTALVCVALNLFCAASAFGVWRGQPRPERAAPADARPRRTARPLWLLGFTGLLGIGYEVLGVRVLSEVAEDTVYTFALLLAVYLAGTAAGAAGYQRWLSRRRDPQRYGAPLLAGLGVSIALSAASLWGAGALRLLVAQVAGDALTAALLAEASIAICAFAPATVMMGAVFSQLAADAHAEGHSFGLALGVNTLGAALAPLLFGVLALPLLGPKYSLLLLAAAYGVLALVGARDWRRPLLWASVAPVLLLAVFAPPLAYVDLSGGARLVHYRDGVMAAVSVVEDADGVARLRIDDRQQEGSSGTRLIDARQAWLPALLHPAPHRALFLGLGTGITAAAAAEDPRLTVDAVELLPEVIEASAFFIDSKSSARREGRFTLHATDARRYVRASRQRYDLVVADNFHPARNGSGALYTVEHFRAVRGRLNDEGVFCQWLPLHQLDIGTLRSILRSFLVVYPNAFAILANNSLETPVLGLVGRASSGLLDAAPLKARRNESRLAPLVRPLGLDDDYALFGSIVAGTASLARLAGDAPLNTDDHPVVTYLAPRITYAPDSQPRDRLVALLRVLSVEPGELFAPGADDAAWQGHLAAYWRARNRFIEIGRVVRPSADPRAMLAQVQGPLLDVLRMSPEFRPGYDPLLQLAVALAPADLAGARSLLEALRTVQPQRPEADAALRRLDAGT